MHSIKESNTNLSSKTSNFNTSNSCEIFDKSKSGKYVDYSGEVAKDLAYFYATAGKVDEGIKFFKRNNLKATEASIQMAGFLERSGHSKEAVSILNETLGKKNSN